MNTPSQQLKYFIIVLVFLFPSSSYSQESSILDLLQTCKSENSIEVYEAIRRLRKIPSEKYNMMEKVALSELLVEETRHLDKIIKIVGFAGMENELLAFAQRKKWNKKTRESINLALVRSGNVVKINSMLRGINKISTSDEFAYNAVSSLVYARQKPIMDNLLDRIMEKGEKCLKADLETSGNISCAYPIIEQIAPYIIDFPVKTNNLGIISDNHPAMLQEVRKWIVSNKETYRINYQIY